MNDLEVLKEYIDALELIRETREDIKELDIQRKANSKDVVKGSMEEYPYVQRSVVIEGIGYIKRNEEKRANEMIQLEKRIQAAERIKEKAQEIINRAPLRIQRIIRYKYQMGMTWKDVSWKMGRRSSAGALKKELYRYLGEK